LLGSILYLLSEITNFINKTDCCLYWIHEKSQGFSNFIPQFSKSLIFLVTRQKLLCFAVAAIKESIDGIFSPSNSKDADICPPFNENIR